MPFKEEDISHDPYLKLYHDVIFEEEIKYIIDKAEKDVSKINTISYIRYNKYTS